MFFLRSRDSLMVDVSWPMRCQISPSCCSTLTRLSNYLHNLVLQWIQLKNNALSLYRLFTTDLPVCSQLGLPGPHTTTLPALAGNKSSGRTSWPSGGLSGNSKDVRQLCHPSSLRFWSSTTPRTPPSADITLMPWILPALLGHLATSAPMSATGSSPSTEDGGMLSVRYHAPHSPLGVATDLRV